MTSAVTGTKKPESHSPFLALWIRWCYRVSAALAGSEEVFGGADERQTRGVVSLLLPDPSWVYRAEEKERAKLKKVQLLHCKGVF